MPDDAKEPQSYGSQKDWSTGKVGQTVNRQKSGPTPEHADFYGENVNAPRQIDHQGGDVSPLQLAENEQPHGMAEGADNAVRRVTAADGGAKRDGYFKKRDYE